MSSGALEKVISYNARDLKQRDLQNLLRYSDSNLHTYVTVKSLKFFVGDSARTLKSKGFGVANITYMKQFACS